MAFPTFPVVDLTKQRAKLTPFPGALPNASSDEVWLQDAVVRSLKLLGILDVVFSTEQPPAPISSRQMWLDYGLTPTGQPGILKRYDQDAQVWVALTPSEFAEAIAVINRAIITSSETPPPSPQLNDWWYKPSEGRMHAYVFVADAAAAWVDVNGATVPDLTAIIAGSAAALAEAKDALEAATNVSIYTSDGAGAVSRATSVKLRDVKTPEDFGAVGDGSADDLPALQRAISWAEASGGRIQLSARAYRIVGTLVVRRGGVSIEGVPGAWTFGSVEPRGSRLVYAGESGGAVVRIEPDPALPPYVMGSVRLSGVTIDGAGSAGTGLFLGSIYESTIEDVAVVGAQSIGVYCGVTWTTGGHLNYRNTLRKIKVSGLGSTGHGFFFDGPATTPGGYNTSFLSGHDLHVTHTGGTAFFLRKCDDVHLYNCASSRPAGATGYVVRFYGSHSEQRMATGNFIWGLQASGGSGAPEIYVDYDAANPSSPFMPRNNTVYCTAVDYQIGVVGPGAHLLNIEDNGSYSPAIAPRGRGVPKVQWRQSTGTADVIDFGAMERRTTGVSAPGVGIGHPWDIQNAAGNLVRMGRIALVALNVTPGACASEWRFEAMLGNALSTVMRVSPNGLGFAREALAVVDAKRDQAGLTRLLVENLNAGVAAFSGLDLVSNAGQMHLRMASVAANAYGLIGSTAANGLFIDAQHATGGVTIRTGAAATTAMVVAADQSVTMSRGLLLSAGGLTATHAQDGVSRVGITNTNAGSAAVAQLRAVANAGTTAITQVSTAAGGAGGLACDAEGGLDIDATHASGAIRLRTGAAPTTAMTIAPDQSVTMAKGLALSAGGVAATHNQNAGSLISVTNSDAGALASAQLRLVSSAGVMSLTHVSAVGGSYAILNVPGAGGLFIDVVAGASHNLRVAGTTRAQVNGTGINVAGLISINGTAVVAARKQGWAVPGGIVTRSTFNSSTVTLQDLAQRVAAIITDLHADSSGHGLFGV